MDPSKVNFYELNDIQTMLQSLGLTETQYYRSLSVRFNLCFVNNYTMKALQFGELILIYNPFLIILRQYVLTSQTSETVRQAAKEAATQNKEKVEQMKK